MAMGLLGGLSGMSSNMCFACNSHNCHHIQQQMGAQQMSQYYDALRNVGNGSILVSNGSTSSIAVGSSTAISVSSSAPKHSNKKLLLLRR